MTPLATIALLIWNLGFSQALAIPPGGQSLNELVQLAATGEEMKGHLLASRELYAFGEATYAAIHAAHPFQELWSLLQSPLAQTSPALTEEIDALLEKPVREIDAEVPLTRPEPRRAENRVVSSIRRGS